MYYIITPIGRKQATHIKNDDGSTVFIATIEEDVVDSFNCELHTNINGYTPIAKQAVPSEVPLWAFRAILTADDKITEILNAIEQQEPQKRSILKTFIEYGNYIDRSNASLKGLATLLGKTDNEIDDIFIRANNIKI